MQAAALTPFDCHVLQSEQQRLAEADKVAAQAARKQEDLQRALQASQQSVSRLEAEFQTTQQALAAAQADAQEAHADAAQKQQVLSCLIALLLLIAPLQVPCSLLPPSCSQILPRHETFPCNIDTRHQCMLVPGLLQSMK
jgi:predicted component of type VI protein secretion system